MSLGDINVSLNLDGRNFSTTIKNASGEVLKFQQKVDSGTSAIERSQNAISRWARGLRNFSLTLAALPYALRTLNDMFLTLPASILRSNAELERMNVLMAGLARGATTMAEAQDQAAKKMEFLLGVADRTPFDLSALTDTMVKFTAAGIDPMLGGYEALIDAVAKYGGTSEILKRASIAVQQMAGKGVVSMEELRQQLGEAVPDAINQMARAMGVGMGELVDNISRGIVESQNALQAMFNQMTFESYGAARQMATTWDGLMGRLATRWMIVQKEIGDQGAFAQLKGLLEDLVDLVGSPQFLAAATKFGQTLNDLITKTVAFTQAVIEHWDAIKLLITAYLAYRVTSSQFAASIVQGVRSLNDFRNQLKTTVPEISRLKREIKMLEQHQKRIAQTTSVTSAQMATQATMIQNLTGKIQAKRAQITMLSAAWSGVASAMASAVVPTLLMTGVITGLVYAYDRLIGSEQRWAEVRRNNDIAMTLSSLDEYRTRAAKLAEEIARLERQIAAPYQYREGGMLEGLGDVQLPGSITRVRELRDELEQMGQLVTDSELFIINNQAASGAERAMRRLDSVLNDVRITYTSLVSESSESFAKGQLTPEAFAELQTRLRAEQQQGMLMAIESFKLQAQAQLDATNELIAQAGSNIDVELRARAEAYRRQIEMLEEKSEEISRLQTENFDMLTVSNRNSNEMHPFERFLMNLEIRVAGLQEQVGGGIRTLGAFEKALSEGRWGELSEEQQAQTDTVRALLRAQEEYTRELERQAEVQKLLNSSNTVLENQMGRIAAEAERLGGSENPWLEASTGARQLEKSFAQVNQRLNDTVALTADERRQLEELRRGFESALDQQRLLDFNTALNSMRTSTESMNQSLHTTRDRQRLNYEESIRFLDEWAETNQEILSQNEDMLRVFDHYKDALQRVYLRETSSAVESTVRTWHDASEAIDQMWAGAMDRMARTLSDFLVRGKADFRSFAEDIVAMIVEIQIKMLAAGLITNLMPGFGAPMPGTPGPAGSIPIPNAKGGIVGPNGAMSVSNFATGGIMTKWGRAKMKEYAAGGIAHSPQISVFGEGTSPEAYVPLPDGRSIPVTMQGGNAPNIEINVINKSGQEVQARSGQPKFDGKKMILDVVLDAVSRPGPFRDTIRGAVS